MTPFEKPRGAGLEEWEAIPKHPSHNRKEILAFVLAVAGSVAVWYGLAYILRWETAALYVFGLGPIAAVLSISLFRTVRCPECERKMRRQRVVAISGNKWEIFCCQRCEKRWRIEQPVRSGI